MRTFSARAPGRVELLGNHTDYNQGVVLAAAIDRFVTVEGAAREDRTITVESKAAAASIRSSLDRLVSLDEPNAWANYVLGVVHVLREQNLALGGFDLCVAGDLPIGAGLSSSAALEVATARFLVEAFELEIRPLLLAKLCRRAENEFVGVKCGLLDQISSLLGRQGHAVYMDCRNEQVENVPLPAGTVLLVIHCGVAHRLVDGEYNERRAYCLSAARELGVAALRDVSSARLAAARFDLDPLTYRCALHIVGENERVFAGVEHLRAGDTDKFGQLMFASHESSRLYFRNSTPELDVLVDLARKERGVYGSRLTGGGFGGATVSLVECSHADRLAHVIQQKYAQATGNVGCAYLFNSANGWQAHGE